MRAYRIVRCNLQPAAIIPVLLLVPGGAVENDVLDRHRIAPLPVVPDGVFNQGLRLDQSSSVTGTYSRSMLPSFFRITSPESLYFHFQTPSIATAAVTRRTSQGPSPR